MSDSRPIGLIDSGIGGFTVLKELQNRLPGENILYLGDSKRMPYGECDNADIIRYANSDIRFLTARHCKAILLACNTISSLMPCLTATVPLYSIVEAGCLATLEACPPGPVGLIATRATVKNGAYPRILATLTKDIYYVSHGTRTLASVINNYPEEIKLLQKHIHLAIDPLIEEHDITTLLLGCTHFPIVRENIEAMYPGLGIINPATKQIDMLLTDLCAHNTLNTETESGNTRIVTTGTQGDKSIFATMIRYLRIRCDDLQQCRLDIDSFSSERTYYGTITNT